MESEIHFLNSIKKLAGDRNLKPNYVLNHIWENCDYRIHELNFSKAEANK